MGTYQILGIAIGAILALFGAIKLELIKAWVKKLTNSDTAQTKVLSVILLIAVFVIPALAGFAMPETEKKDEAPNQEQQQAKRTTKEGEIIDAATESAVTLSRLGSEIADQVKEDNRERREAYLAKKGNRWVYKIGDAMTSAAIPNLHMEIDGKDIGRVSLFKDKRKYFFFAEPGSSKAELDASLQDFQDRVGNIKVEIVDLTDWTNHKKPNIVLTEPFQIKRKKEKIEISCFSAER